MAYLTRTWQVATGLQFILRRQVDQSETVRLRSTLEFFTNLPQYKNGNIANFVLIVPLDINYQLSTNEVYNIGM